MSQELKTLLGESAERHVFLESLRDRLPTAQFERIVGIFKLLGGLLDLLERKNLSIAKLRQLCFGATTESARNVCGRESPKEKPKAKGRGRNSHCTCAMVWRATTPKGIRRWKRSAMSTRGETLWT